MCRRVTCGECHKYTWAGCGRHIEQALAGLSKDQICSCKDNQDKQPKELNKAPITDIKDICLNM